MTTTMKLVMFSYDSNISIAQYIPSLEILKGLVTRWREYKLEIIACDPQLPQVAEGGVTFINDFLYNWADTHPLDNIEGEVIFVAIKENLQGLEGEKKKTKEENPSKSQPAETKEEEFDPDEIPDTYSIMEELETQKYNDRYYFAVPVPAKSPIDLEEFLRKWEDLSPQLGEEKSSSSFSSGSSPSKSKSPPRSPKSVATPSETPKRREETYQLYSGGKVPSYTVDQDYDAILWRMLLICENIIAYLEMAFDKSFYLEDMRVLPSDEGYKKKPFYSEAEIENMVLNGHLFQAEDPILKGFLLAHPIRVSIPPAEEFADPYKNAPVSPLTIGRNIQYLIFNHGQFRKELLLSFMKVVASFAANNGLLFPGDITEEVEQPKRTVTERKAPLTAGITPIVTPATTSSTGRRVGVTGANTGQIREIQPMKDEEVVVVKKRSINKAYFSRKTWNLIIDRLRVELRIEPNPVPE
jgi:hypothetical protein